MNMHALGQGYIDGDNGRLGFSLSSWLGLTQNGSGAGIRPLISLKSNIQLKPGVVIDSENNIREWNFAE